MSTNFQSQIHSKSSDVRQLNDAEKEKLEKQNSRMVTPFMAQKIEKEARKYWDQFYKRNQTKFFKDRHWIFSEFHEDLCTGENEKNSKILLEVGCGVGNLIFPILEEQPETFQRIYGCDFSKNAIELVKQHPLYDSSKVKAFEADVTSSDLCQTISDKVDLVTLIFVLSAIHPDKILQSLKNISSCIKTGGVVLFRDYAVNDMTQIRFKPGHKIDQHFYMRQDGTRTLFYTIEKVREVFQEAGFSVVELCYIHSKTVNVKEEIDVPRTFVQGKFMKIL